jgi:diadenylate cyclase
MLLNRFTLLPTLLARTALSTLFPVRVSFADWIEIALICILGAVIATIFFVQHSHTYRCLAWNVCLCTVVLALAVLFEVRFLVYFVCGCLMLVVILYQQELRELILKVAGSRAFAPKRTVATLDMQQVAIDAVCQAAVELARSKTGALIVLEHHIKLDDIARSGIELDAKISQYLIRNVFYDKAPLHDGAVLIRNCRLWSAGCILPLTSRTDVDPDLGTRHRAAIGLSEICDAVIIVVSEETGVISVAHQSNLTRNYSFQTLHAYLAQHLLHTSEEHFEDR